MSFRETLSDWKYGLLYLLNPVRETWRNGMNHHRWRHLDPEAHKQLLYILRMSRAHLRRGTRRSKP